MASTAKTYTVKNGDTLSGIAVAYKSVIGDNLTLDQRIQKLVSLNNIENVNYLVVGQVLKLTEGSSSSGSSVTTSYDNTVGIKNFGLVSNTSRQLYISWYWGQNYNGFRYTDHYRVRWEYHTGDKEWFLGDDSNTEEMQSLYSAPSNAIQVRVSIKPISKTHTVNGKEAEYWTAKWCNYQYYNFTTQTPPKPPKPTLSIDEDNKFKLKCEVDIEEEPVGATGTTVTFDIKRRKLQNGTWTSFQSPSVTVKDNHASYVCNIESGYEYKARCRTVRMNGLRSDYSDYSHDDGKGIHTIPPIVSGITEIKATSKTSIHLKWASSVTATKYDIEYTTKKEYFDGSDQVNTVNNIETIQYEKTGLETGNEYFFRVRAVNDIGESAWSEIKSVIIGSNPNPPTTWSSSTTVMVGEPLTLYWVHNSEDNSDETYAQINLIKIFSTQTDKKTITIKNTSEEDTIRSYTVDTSLYEREGVKLQWQVRTAGIIKNDDGTPAYGEWSTPRTVDVYTPPILQLNLVDPSDNEIQTVSSFPFFVRGIASGSSTLQIPIGYSLIVTSNQAYETVDQTGSSKIVNKGNQIYSKYFNTRFSGNPKKLLVKLSPDNIDLENNMEYTVTCTMYMDSGLTAEASQTFDVAWEETDAIPNAELLYDEDTVSINIRPYCVDMDGNDVADVTLSVYRREYDGSFVELATGIDGSSNTFITDPHPSLDYARYRIVSTSKTTGHVTYYDLPGYPIAENSIIIQWDEEWINFNTTNEDPLYQQPWSGSMLKLPYNIDISDSTNKDVSLVEYIGRKNPVSYYGTQLGETSSWSTVIDKEDKDTIYALRRLSKWMGDVYVREPSGSGYWANISVSFPINHCEVTIPVTFEIAKVEGGM